MSDTYPILTTRDKSRLSRLEPTEYYTIISIVDSATAFPAADQYRRDVHELRRALFHRNFGPEAVRLLYEQPDPELY